MNDVQASDKDDRPVMVQKKTTKISVIGRVAILLHAEVV